MDKEKVAKLHRLVVAEYERELTESEIDLYNDLLAYADSICLYEKIPSLFDSYHDDQEILIENIGDKTLEDYLHGSCHIFVLALNMEYGHPIQLVMDANDLETGREVLIHAYCVSGNRAIDARGFYDKKYVLKSFDYNEPYHKDVTEQELREMIEKGFGHFPTDGEIESLREYIKKNEFRYK
jgi:hypothetical protein